MFLNLLLTHTLAPTHLHTHTQTQMNGFLATASALGAPPSPSVSVTLIPISGRLGDSRSLSVTVAPFTVSVTAKPISSLRCVNGYHESRLSENVSRAFGGGGEKGAGQMALFNCCL